jgi:hypothetical protein
MGLSVDLRKIVHVSIVPWEIDEKTYGIAYRTTDGIEGADKIGTRAETQRLIAEIRTQKAESFNGATKHAANANIRG